jgi:hypothetical protein
MFAFPSLLKTSENDSCFTMFVQVYPEPLWDPLPLLVAAKCPHLRHGEAGVTSLFYGHVSLSNN